MFLYVFIHFLFIIDNLLLQALTKKEVKIDTVVCGGQYHHECYRPDPVANTVKTGLKYLVLKKLKYST